MLDTPTRANAADFKQRYCSGYGLYLTESKKRIVVLLHTMSDGRLHFRDSGGQEYFVNLDSNAEFEFLPSVRGWHQQAHRPVFLSRIPARQYNRGINGNNTAASVVISGTRWKQVEVDHELVDSLFAEDAPPLATRVSQFMKRVMPFCVLSPYFCLIHGVVFLSNIAIGTYTTTSLQVDITLTNNIATQELTDLIRRNQLPMQVTA